LKGIETQRTVSVEANSLAPAGYLVEEAQPEVAWSQPLRLSEKGELRSSFEGRSTFGGRRHTEGAIVLLGGIMVALKSGSIRRSICTGEGAVSRSSVEVKRKEAIDPGSQKMPPKEDLVNLRVPACHFSGRDWTRHILLKSSADLLGTSPSSTPSSPLAVRL
jgi:hypothetical protein